MKMVHISHIENGRLAQCYVEPEVYGPSEDDITKAAEVIRQALIWVHEGNHRKNRWMNRARLVAFTYVFCPSALEHKSVRELVKDMRGEVSRGYLSDLISECRSRFKPR